MSLCTSVFAGARVERIERYGPGEQGAEGSVKQAALLLGEQRFLCTDTPAKHEFTFTPSMSIFVECADADELDEAFTALSAGGQVLMPLGSYGFSTRFAWVSDRFGVSWQLNLA
jgi:predicted 3-demethylubiquinone-9 3-methyltransferase (glyoxalase superfamily)